MPSLGVVASIFGTLLTSGVQVIVVPPVLFYLNWKLAALSLIGLPLTTAISLGASRLVRRYAKHAAESNAEMQSSQIDALAQIRTVKLLCTEHEVFGQIRDLASATLRLQLKSTGLTAVVSVLRATVSGVATALFTWYGWVSILNQSMTLGGFLAFSAYLRYLTGPVTSLSSLLTDFQVSAVSLGRLFEYLDLKPEVTSQSLYAPRVVQASPVAYDVEFRDVSFSYGPTGKALHSVSFVVPGGSTLAIVGASGAGKSTLIRLLCKMDVPQTGDILLGGESIRKLQPIDVRSQMSAVWQEIGLIRGTLRQNLLLGVPTRDAARLKAVLEVCRLEELVSSLPDGLDSQLGEAGVRVSGGQRQRIVLARALLRESALLILDEATSNIDGHTESALLRDLLAMEQQRTVIYVTHRVHTAEYADFVLVMHHGSVDGFGTHSTLLSTSLHYRGLWKAHAAIEQAVDPMHALVGSA